MSLVVLQGRSCDDTRASGRPIHLGGMRERGLNHTTSSNRVSNSWQDCQTIPLPTLTISAPHCTSSKYNNSHCLLTSVIHGPLPPRWLSLSSSQTSAPHFTSWSGGWSDCGLPCPDSCAALLCETSRHTSYKHCTVMSR